MKFYIFSLIIQKYVTLAHNSIITRTVKYEEFLIILIFLYQILCEFNVILFYECAYIMNWRRESKRKHNNNEYIDDTNNKNHQVIQ